LGSNQPDWTSTDHTDEHNGDGADRQSVAIDQVDADQGDTAPLSAADAEALAVARDGLVAYATILMAGPDGPTNPWSAEELTALLQTTGIVDHLHTIAKVKGEYYPDLGAETDQACQESDAAPEADRPLLMEEVCDDGTQVRIECRDQVLECSVVTTSTRGGATYANREHFIALPLDGRVYDVAGPYNVDRQIGATMDRGPDTSYYFPEYDEEADMGSRLEFVPYGHFIHDRRDPWSFRGYAGALQWIVSELLMVGV